MTSIRDVPRPAADSIEKLSRNTAFSAGHVGARHPDVCSHANLSAADICRLIANDILVSDAHASQNDRKLCHSESTAGSRRIGRRLSR